MPTFKNKEEYQKWKAEKAASIVEKIQNQKDEEERQQKLKEEDEKLNRLWVCPECISSNDISQLKCNCGYVIDETLLQYVKGSLTAEELYKAISNELFIGNNERASLLATYLLKRFPDTEEAKKLSESIKYNPNLINCPTCNNEISINAEACPKCGEPITDEKKKKAATSIDLSHIEEKESAKTEIIKRKGGLDGFILGIPMAIVCFALGIFLSMTGIGSLIGMPLVIVSFFIPFVLAFITLSFISGPCPYCGHKVLAQTKKTGVNCSACKKRIVIGRKEKGVRSLILT
jgi:DNA-directed RNA polymerase subunit M/transcription elongation factor TFIIS